MDFGVSDAKIHLGEWGMGNGLQQVCHQHPAAGGFAGVGVVARYGADVVSGNRTRALRAEVLIDMFYADFAKLLGML